MINRGLMGVAIAIHRSFPGGVGELELTGEELHPMAHRVGLVKCCTPPVPLVALAHLIGDRLIPERSPL